MNAFHKSNQYSVYQCSTCFEAWPLNYNPRNLHQYQCNRCKKDKLQPKMFSRENNMIRSLVPLQNLTQVEEMLIARVLPIMRIYIKPGGQKGYFGHCVNLPQIVSEIAVFAKVS